MLLSSVSSLSPCPSPSSALTHISRTTVGKSRALCVRNAVNSTEEPLENSNAPFAPVSVQSSRRELLRGAALSFSLSLSPFLSESNRALALKDVAVGAFLPKSEDGEFVVYIPGPNATPALRAGNVARYSVQVPPSWTQARIANILSGNYCQPKCAEPWVEAKFESAAQGTLQIFASPIVRLTNKPTAPIEEIGDPLKIIAALGPFVTGDSFDPEEVLDVGVEKKGDLTYYSYALETPYARSGQHNLAVATAKGETILLMVVSATDKQWVASEPVLRSMISSFEVL